MSNQQILKSLPSATSLQASEGGAEHCSLQGGVQNDLFGLEAHHANHSQQQETEKDKMMSDTCGQSSLISLESASLQQSLASRLQQQLGQAGSTIYKLTWKQKTTPRQWPYCQLAASVPRTKETGFSMSQGGWATPNTMDYMSLRSDEALLRQATTTRKGRTFPANLREQVDTRSQEIYAKKQIPRAAWPTPAARDYRDTGNLDKSRYRKDGKERLDTVPRIAFGVEKPSTAETESIAPSQLNPRFSLWLMGYPIEWAYCAERVTPSSRKRRQK